MDTSNVLVKSRDDLKQRGVESLLRASGAITVLDPSAGGSADVVVVVDASGSDMLTGTETGTAGSRRRGSGPPSVLVTDYFDDKGILAAVGRGLRGVVPMSAATGPMLVGTVLDVAAGRAHLSAQLQGALLRQVDMLRTAVLEPAGFVLSGLSLRECDVLRLLAEGIGVGDIATKLSFSERTVKNVLYGVIGRMGLRNRTHAVAYAARVGVC